MDTERTLLLHIGLPKTASSALQFWADGNRQLLLAHGVHYPAPAIGPLAPKHQDIVGGLFGGNLMRLQRYLAMAEAPVLFLSSEGLTNYLYDFPPASLAAWRETVAGWRVRLLMVTRPSEGWMTSYWKQAILNPPAPQFDYATALSRDVFARQPRMRRLANFEQVLADARAAYGATDAVVADQSGDWFGTLRDMLGLPGTVRAPDRLHVSVSDDLAEIVRQVNGLGLSDTGRAQVLALVQHALCTGHNSLMAYGREYPLAALAQEADAISGCLLGIAPVTEGQEEILGSVTEKLACLAAERKS